MPQRKLHIDIETFSSENLKTSGIYRYAEADDFAILLFAYGYDNYAPRVVDLAAGEQIPLDVVADMIDENVLKVAHNAQFERVCLRAHYLKKGNPKMAEIIGNPRQWDCTAVKAARLGLPMPLADVAEVLKLDAQKDKEGKSLIQFFSVPQKTKLLSDRDFYLKHFPDAWDTYMLENELDIYTIPELVNGKGGDWKAIWSKFFKICKDINELNPLTHVNAPKDFPEKWEAYKKYNRQDVIVEQAIDTKLEFYVVTDFERELYILDQKINDRGVLIDLPFVKSVLKIDQVYTDSLWNEAIEITGLDNPNSATQLKKWLEVETGETITTLRKEDVTDLMKTAAGDKAQRMLQIRQELAKTSIKKYDAMLACVCKDGRARGLFQFYGAGRTGRWAGRLIQMQNLPKSDYKQALQVLRDLAAEGNADEIDMLFGNIPSQLSQLIRTAFISAEGMQFNVSDFSAIEARVLAYLAGEEWRLDVFRGDGKIYEASAAQMFKVPVESITKGNPLRQKGKVAELACIAEGQLVLTHLGLVPIENILPLHKVWDGENFVNHDGLVFKGVKNVITYGNLTATADHLVWVEGQSRPIQFSDASASGARLLQTGNSRTAVRLGENSERGKKMESGLAAPYGINSLHKLCRRAVDRLSKSCNGIIERLSILFSASENTEMVGQTFDGGETALHKSERWELFKLRCKRYSVQVREYFGGRSLPDRGVRFTRQEIRDRQGKQQRPLREGQFEICDQIGEPVKSQRLKTYDILNAGPNNRFTVSNVLVHNCGYGGGPGALEAMGALNMGLQKKELQPLITAWRKANPNIVSFWKTVEKAAIAAVHTNVLQVVEPGLKFFTEKGTLFIELPSGRRLSYHNPSLSSVSVVQVQFKKAVGKNEVGDKAYLTVDEANKGRTLEVLTIIGDPFERRSLSYESMNSDTHQWGKEKTYGGKLVENITQAFARDCLAWSMIELDKLGYYIVGHVHDEIIDESADKDIHVMEQLMSTEIPWAPGLPLGAEGFVSPFYRK